MQIGEVIRKYRKEQGMTQEEMAKRLGVTTPAVNKWENGNSMPDISLLAPIARLLGVSLDELLGYREALTKEEIADYVQELDQRLKAETYQEAFVWAKRLVEAYPNCLELIWQMAVVLDAQRMMQEISEDAYESYILDCYMRVLKSEEEKLRTCAADSLFHYYLRKEAYDTAESFLKYYSEQNPERKRKQAVIYSKIGRKEEAFKTYEELLFFGYQMLNMVFNGLYLLAIEENDLEKADYFVKKQELLARLFEMGAYHEAACRLDLAVVQKDEEMIARIQSEMMEGLTTITSFTKSPLYGHMTFKEVSHAFIKELKEQLEKGFEEIGRSPVS